MLLLFQRAFKIEDSPFSGILLYVVSLFLASFHSFPPSVTCGEWENPGEGTLSPHTFAAQCESHNLGLCGENLPQKDRQRLLHLWRFCYRVRIFFTGHQYWILLSLFMAKLFLWGEGLEKGRLKLSSKHNQATVFFGSYLLFCKRCFDGFMPFSAMCFRGIGPYLPMVSNGLGCALR